MWIESKCSYCNNNILHQPKRKMRQDYYKKI